VVFAALCSAKEARAKHEDGSLLQFLFLPFRRKFPSLPLSGKFAPELEILPDFHIAAAISGKVTLDFAIR
jgi:hypothetical protein